jgi:hypothetical protein
MCQSAASILSRSASRFSASKDLTFRWFENQFFIWRLFIPVTEHSFFFSASDGYGWWLLSITHFLRIRLIWSEKFLRSALLVLVMVWVLELGVAGNGDRGIIDELVGDGAAWVSDGKARGKECPKSKVTSLT